MLHRKFPLSIVPLLPVHVNWSARGWNEILTLNLNRQMIKPCLHINYIPCSLTFRLFVILIQAVYAWCWRLWAIFNIMMKNWIGYRKLGDMKCRISLKSSFKDITHIVVAITIYYIECLGRKKDCFKNTSKFILRIMATNILHFAAVEKQFLYIYIYWIISDFFYI